MADVIFPGQTPLGTLGADRLPGNLDLQLWQGDSQTYIIKLNAQDGTAIDLTGYTPTAVIRATYTDPTMYHFQCTQTDTNEITLYMSTANCALIAPGSYIWEFSIAAPNGDVRTYLAGDVTVYAEVDA